MAASAAAREIVLVDCPDDVGLIHRITGVLGAHRLNIESNHEFVDADARHFFFRAEVTPAAGEAALPASGVLATELARVLPSAARVRVTRAERRPRRPKKKARRHDRRSRPRAKRASRPSKTPSLRRRR